MSKEQANTFKKFRDSPDPVGNLGWASKLAKKALRVAPEAPEDVERTFELSDDERVLWRILKIARKYTDLETSGILPTEKARAVLRGMVSADVVDVLEGHEAKALLPLEINRIKRSLSGADGPEIKKKSIDERVFRPDISNVGPSTGTTSPPDHDGGPAPIDFGDTPKTPAEAMHSQSPARPLTAPPKTPAPTRPFTNPPKTPSPTQSFPSPPTTNPGGRLRAEHLAIKERIEKAYAERMKASHYVLLGVDPKASQADIKTAFLTLARLWHPDSIASTPLAEDEGFKKKIDALFKRLQDAHSTLSNADERAAYDRSGAAAPVEVTEGKKRRPQDAHAAAVKADVFLKKKEFKQAVQHYRLAVDFDPEDPKLKNALGWAIFLDETRDRSSRIDEAKRLLRENANKHRFADSAYKLGMIARAQDQEEEAQKRFDEALRLDATHVDATRERRLKEMRKQKEEDDKKGLMGKLFKK